MNTRVFRFNLVTSTDIAADLTAICDKQLSEGYSLASTFQWANDLVMIFQKL